MGVKSAYERDLLALSPHFQQRRRRRAFLRRAAVLILMLLFLSLLFGLLFNSAFPSAVFSPSSGPAVVGTVSSVESGNLAEFSAPFSPPPNLAAPDMGRVWDAAVVKEPSPSLAVFGEGLASEGRIALTFDDGPDPLATPQVLDVLQEYEVTATFFVVGSYVEQHPEVVQRIVGEGHSLGNHGYSHTSMSILGEPQLRRELQRTQRAVDKALGYHYPMSTMRPPYGHPYQDGSANLPVFQEVLREKELFPVLWTPSPHDYLFDGRPEGILQSISQLRAEQEGHDEVLLLHDNKQQTADALPAVIELYRSEGLKFTDVHELLADKYLDE